MPNGALKPSEKLRVAIVDDEPLARQLLREYLDADGRVEVAAECANGFEAVKAIGSSSRIWFSWISRCRSSTGLRCWS